MEYYIYISTVIFAFFSIIWKTEDWMNTFIKLFLISLTVAGGAFSFSLLGFVVRQ